MESARRTSGLRAFVLSLATLVAASVIIALVLTRPGKLQSESSAPPPPLSSQEPRPKSLAAAPPGPADPRGSTVHDAIFPFLAPINHTAPSQSQQQHGGELDKQLAGITAPRVVGSPVVQRLRDGIGRDRAGARGNNGNICYPADGDELVDMVTNQDGCMVIMLTRPRSEPYETHDVMNITSPKLIIGNPLNQPIISPTARPAAASADPLTRVLSSIGPERTFDGKSSSMLPSSSKSL